MSVDARLKFFSSSRHLKLRMTKIGITFDFLKKQYKYFPCGSILMKKNRGMRLVENDFQWGGNFVGAIIPSMSCPNRDVDEK
jgi:hypothetical protein